ncbi:uncharacterized protein LOC109536090 [Dendroctonus ponderosae]|nr:uncharacterized protein LOC109536090 [Dendroctonus ponderosae]
MVQHPVQVFWGFLCLICVKLTVGETCPTLITSLHQKNCTDKSDNRTAYYLDKTSCIPRCSIYPTEVQTRTCPNGVSDCITGFNCEGRCSGGGGEDFACEKQADCIQFGPRVQCGKYCVLPASVDDGQSVSCMAYHSNLPEYVNSYWTAQKFKPVCDDDGNWMPKQCKGGLQGRCMCYSSTGVRLFGEAKYKEASNMTCACSRKKADLEAAGRNAVTLHCDSLGNFERLQCDIEKSLCWCAEPFTGDLTAPIVPFAAMAKLPCYSQGTVGSQYLRQCESKKFATTMVTSKLKGHGVVTVQSDSLLCQSDGSYGAYMVQSGIAYCTWRDNSKIGTWQANLAGMTDKLTCNCARDYKRYEHSLSCEGTGNYVLLQQVIDENNQKQYYCVDDYGFAKSGLLSDSTTDCSLFY